MRNDSSESDRRALLQLLDGENSASDLAKRLARCGQPFSLACVACDAVRHVHTRCDLKWCPVCQRARAAMTTDRFKRVMAEVDVRWPLFVTFTCAHDDGDTWELIRHVRRAHTKLRRHRWFKQCVTGGVVAFEAQNSRGGLHPHAHCLLDCRWFAISVREPRFGATAETFMAAARSACREIGEVWSDCLGRRGSVKVRRVWRRDGGDIGAAVAEVIKYSVCGADLVRMPAASAIALIRVLDRTRNVQAFGTFMGHTKIQQQRIGAACPCGCDRWCPDLAVTEARRACYNRDGTRWRPTLSGAALGATD
jgi:Replication protein